MQRQEERRAVIGAVRQPHSLRVGGRLMTFERPVVMGILNVTEDSFYSGCRCTDTAALDARVRQIVSEGAGIIDVGACSTRPGSEPVTPEVETERVLVALDRVRAICDTIPISVDTYRAAVARRAIEAAGIEIINDISSGEMDADMFPLVAETKVGYILTHIQGTPTTMQMAPRYDDLMSDILNFLAQRVMRLQQMGADNLIIDPGFGFGKTLEQNYEILKNLRMFCEFGFPVLAGLSRKSMLYKLLDTTPAGALEATQSVDTIALLNGAHILRVHDVLPAVQAIRIFQTYEAQPCW